jgi:hypothetical protein
MLNGDLFPSSKIAAVMAPGDQAFMKGQRHLRPSPDDVRVIGISEYKEASACLVEAFMEDLAIRYCIDTPDMAHLSAERKQKLYVENMDYVTAAHVYNGLVTTIGSNYASVAIWYSHLPPFSTRNDTYHSSRLPPGKDIENWCTLFRSGLWRMYYKLSPEGRKRFFAEFLPLLHDTKRNVLGERDAESYYLVYLGTRPSEQRKGYGKALIEHVTRQVWLHHHSSQGARG